MSVEGQFEAVAHKQSGETSCYSIACMLHVLGQGQESGDRTSILAQK